MKKQKFNNKNTKKYYHQLYTTFPLHNVQEKKFLTFFKTRLHEYERQYPDCSYQDYIYHFGLPEDIVIDFYHHYDHHYAITHMKSRKILQYASIVLVPLIMACIIYVLYTTYLYYQNYIESYPLYQEEIIYDYGDIPMYE